MGGGVNTALIIRLPIRLIFIFCMYNDNFFISVSYGTQMIYVMLIQIRNVICVRSVRSVKIEMMDGRRLHQILVIFSSPN